MNEITQQIINLDKETVALRSKYEELLRKKKLEGLDALQRLENDLMKTYMEEGEQAYQEIMQKSDIDQSEPGKAEVEWKHNMQNIDDVYNEVKEELIESLWKEILSGEE
ncbi:MAG: hypothetical protein RBT15_01955 [Gudongella sp.]|jgi:hypothetical protein|nr:hypothetical protein [Gudongella sp.]